MSHSSARRSMSMVSCSSAASRASGEAQLSATLKALRVKQMERNMERDTIEMHEEEELKRQEQELEQQKMRREEELRRQEQQLEQQKRRQEEELRRQEEDLRQQIKRREDERKMRRALQAAKDEAEEAALEARLRLQMEDGLNADRKHDFLGENIADETEENVDLERDRNVPLTAETTQTGKTKDGGPQNRERAMAAWTGSETRTPPLHRPPSLQQSGGPASPLRKRTSWIDELPNAPEPLHMPPASPSAHASAFVKSIPRLTLPEYSGDPSE